jgi:hypothetical protein
MSRAQPVTDDERRLLTRGPPAAPSVDVTSRASTLHALEEMLLAASKRVDRRVADEQLLARRAVPVPHTWPAQVGAGLGDPMSLAGADLGVGIHDYDPDYDVAADLVRRRLIGPAAAAAAAAATPAAALPPPPPPHQARGSYAADRGQAAPPVRRTQPAGSPGGDFAAAVAARAAASEPFVDAALRRPAAATAAPYVGAPSDAQDTARALLDDIRERRVDADLLRLGVNRVKLHDQSEEIYSTFVADIMGTLKMSMPRPDCFVSVTRPLTSAFVLPSLLLLLLLLLLAATELCKRRASTATTVEELAMHRALATHVHAALVPAGQVKRARAHMVEVAVETSLRYVASMKHGPEGGGGRAVPPGPGAGPAGTTTTTTRLIAKLQHATHAAAAATAVAAAGARRRDGARPRRGGGR